MNKLSVVLLLPLLFIYILANDNPAFIRLGQISGHFTNGTAYEQTLFISRHFRVNWTDSRSICRDYGMEIATFKTLSTAKIVQQMCKMNTNLLDHHTHVGGITIEPANNKTWYWVDTGKKIDYDLNWVPGEPNDHIFGEYYLELKKPDFLFNDIHNEIRSKFMCESLRRVDFVKRINPTDFICNDCII